MFGAIIGDIVGSCLEFNNHRSKNSELIDESGFATDDNRMTLVVAMVIIKKRNPKVRPFTFMTTIITPCF